MYWRNERVQPLGAATVIAATAIAAAACVSTESPSDPIAAVAMKSP